MNSIKRRQKIIKNQPTSPNNRKKHHKRMHNLTMAYAKFAGYKKLCIPYQQTIGS